MPLIADFFLTQKNVPILASEENCKFVERFTIAMKVLLDIKDSKALHLLEVLKSLPYVKAKTISEEKALLMEEIKEAVDNLKLVRSGKLKARSAKELLDEL